MTNATRAGVGLPIAGGLLLAAATPPALFPGAELLVIAGLMAWFAVATDRRRSLWHAYLLGCVHMAWFSWSVHHYMWFPYAAIVVIGGGYYVLSVIAMRAAAERVATFAFAIAVAGSVWLRAVMPEIYYPHGQPCHSLWQWPSLLHGVVVGAEPLVNALLAAIAAACVQLWRSWRVAIPAWGTAVRGVAITTAAFVVATVMGHAVELRSEDSDAEKIAVAAVEPGVHPYYAVPPTSSRAEWDARWRQLIEQRLIAPTREVMRSEVPPDVVLWPESSVPIDYVRRDLSGASVGAMVGKWPRLRTHLVLGANVCDDVGKPLTPASLQFDLSTGALLGHHEKRLLVPGGEFPPFEAWVPRGIAETIIGWFEAALGMRLARATPGTEREPLKTARGVPFGALMCYDNAFLGPAASQVEAGARWLCVLSNESWFEGGGELVQLTAMTVIRALETGTPIVRCTQDGWSCLVDATGHVTASLPIAAAPQPAARILRVEITPGPGRLPPLAWLRSATGPAAGLLLCALLLHAVLRRARLLPVRTAAHAAADPGSAGIARGSGS